MAMSAFVFGSHAAFYSYSFYGIEREFSLKRRKLFSSLIYGYCLITIVVAAWQVSVSTPLGEYIRELAGYLRTPSTTTSPERYFVRTRETGAIPGIVKMFSYLPLSALFMVVSQKSVMDVSSHENSKKGIRSRTYLVVIFVTVLIRSVFVLDRVVLAGFFVILGYYLLFSVAGKMKQAYSSMKKGILLFIAGLALVGISLESVSSVRQDLGIKDVLAEYCSLGLANLSVMFEHDFDYTYGQNIFRVIEFPLEYAGLTDLLPKLQQPHWVWTRAQYLTGYAYQDFGVFSPVFFFIFGFLATVTHLKA